MGSYVTTASLEPFMVGVDFDSATSETNILAGKCIDWAEAEVNKHVSERYDISGWDSTANTPITITKLTEELSIGYLWEQQSRGGKESLARADRYIDRVMGNLKDIKANKANVLDSSGSEVPDKSSRRSVLSNTTNYPTTFNEDGPLLWDVSNDKLDDIKSGRD